MTRPVGPLTFRVSTGFLDSDVQQGVLATGSIDGQQLPYAPHFSGTVAMDWEAFTVYTAIVDLHLDSNYNSKQYLALPNEDPISQGGYALLNGRLRLKSESGSWEVGVWGRRDSASITACGHAAHVRCRCAVPFLTPSGGISACTIRRVP